MAWSHRGHASGSSAPSSSRAALVCTARRALRWSARRALRAAPCCSWAAWSALWEAATRPAVASTASRRAARSGRSACRAARRASAAARARRSGSVCSWARGLVLAGAARDEVTLLGVLAVCGGELGQFRDVGDVEEHLHQADRQLAGGSGPEQYAVVGRVEGDGVEEARPPVDVFDAVAVAVGVLGRTGFGPLHGQGTKPEPFEHVSVD